MSSTDRKKSFGKIGTNTCKGTCMKMVCKIRSFFGGIRIILIIMKSFEIQLITKEAKGDYEVLKSCCLHYQAEKRTSQSDEMYSSNSQSIHLSLFACLTPKNS